MWAFQYKHGDRPLEGFAVQRAAGRGGFGEVYYAVSDSGREVALKVVQGYEQIELRGISQCMNLKSPHLVTIFDVKYNHENKPFVIMEFVSGLNLRQLLDESPAGLGTQKAAFFLREIAKGLTFLHECGIVHRDLKPANIFYENGYVKIGDYGLSKAITASQHSGQTVTVGTVHYMAPEIGAGKYDRSIDIYAMGAVLYEMLTGMPPHVGASASEILMKHLSSEPDVSNIPQPFARVIQKAMAKDPNQRYQTVQAMVEDVFGAEHVRQSVSVFAPEDLSVIAERVARKTPVAVGAGGGGGGGASSSLPGAAHQTDPLARVGSWMDDVGGCVKQMWNVPPGAAVAGIVPSAANDPLAARHRWQIALLVSVLAPLATTLVAPRVLGAAPAAFFFVFLSMWGATAGLLIANLSIVPRLGNDSIWVQRLVAGQCAALLAVVASLPAWVGAGADFTRVGGTLLSILAPMFIFDTREPMQLDRAERVGFGHIFGGALVTFIACMFFRGHANLAVASAAGIGLLVQVLSPWDPKAGAVTKARKAAGEDEDEDEDDEDSAKPARPAFKVVFGLSPEEAVVLPRNADPRKGPVGHARPGQRYWSRPVWGFARIIWLGGLVAFITLGVMLCVASSLTSHYDEEAALIASGVGALILGAFCGLKALCRTFYGWWGYLIKPLAMTLCVIAITVSGIMLGSLPPTYLGEEGLIACTFFIVFPSLLLIVLFFIPGKFPSARVAAPTPSQSPVSPYRRNWALVLTAIAFAGVCGLQRLYVGKIGTGIIWLLTFGLCGIGQIVDAIQLLAGSFTDKQGRRVTQWGDSPMPNEIPQRDLRDLNKLNELGELRELDELRNLHAAPAPEKRQGFMHEVEHVVTDVADAFKVAATDVRRELGSGSAVFGDMNFGGLLSALAGLLIFVATLATLALAIDVPAMFEAGVPSPEIAQNIEMQFPDIPDWPALMTRLAGVSIAIVMIVAVTALIFARQRGGIVHMLRGVMGSVGLLVASAPIAATIEDQRPWNAIGGLVAHKQYAPAVDEFFKNFQNPNGALAAGIFLVSIVLLAWPARKLHPAPPPPISAAKGA